MVKTLTKLREFSQHNRGHNRGQKIPDNIRVNDERPNAFPKTGNKEEYVLSKFSFKLINEF